MNEQDCLCLNEPMNYDQYKNIKFIGIDETKGRYGEVNLWQCKNCHRNWLHYRVEYEAFPKSGRYFMGLVTLKKAGSLSPSTVIEYLNNLEWRLYGGSYFGKKGRSTDKANPDLW